jgi:hypothetical protein
MFLPKKKGYPKEVSLKYLLIFKNYSAISTTSSISSTAPLSTVVSS